MPSHKRMCFQAFPVPSHHRGQRSLVDFSLKETMPPGGFDPPGGDTALLVELPTAIFVAGWVVLVHSEQVDLVWVMPTIGGYQIEQAMQPQRTCCEVNWV